MSSSGAHSGQESRGGHTPSISSVPAGTDCPKPTTLCSLRLERSEIVERPPTSESSTVAPAAIVDHASTTDRSTRAPAATTTSAPITESITWASGCTRAEACTPTPLKVRFPASTSRLA